MMTINLFVSLLINTQRHNQLELNMMKKVFWVILFALCMTISVQAQVIDEGSLKKATGWVNDLQLNDKAKEERIIQVIAKHLAAIRDWHNEHADMIPDGAINPQTGKKLSALERQVIADSSQPASIRQALLDGLNTAKHSSKREQADRLKPIEISRHNNIE